MPRPPRGAALILVFPLAALGLFLLNAHNAYNPTDDGFILALSWRILHGEVPYRDFLYIRTPLTPYLHTVELMLPEGWALIAGRAAYYAELTVSAAAPTLWVATHLGIRATATGVALVAAVFFASAHNFPPMPWATVDGIFFASIGVTAFLGSTRAAGRSAVLLLVAASVAFAAAGLAKQSFFALSALLVAYAILEAITRRAWLGLAAATIPASLILGLVVTYFWSAGALDPFARSIVEPAALRPTSEMPWSGDFLAGAVLPYVRALDPGVLAAMIGAFAATYWPGRGPLRGGLSVLLVVAGLTAAAFVLPLNAFRAGLQLWWILFAMAVGWSASSGERNSGLALLAVLATAWCASLSFAYQTPLLALGSGGIFVERMLARVAWPRAPFMVALSAAATISLVFWLDVERPYRDLPREAQVSDLAAIYPRSGHLYTNATNTARFQELRDLSTRYALAVGRPFVVAPDYPLVYYLSNTLSPLSIDWIQPQEYLGHEARLQQEIAASRPVFLIAREPSGVVGAPRDPMPPCDPPVEPQPVIEHVVTHGRLIAEGGFFCVWDP